MPPPASYVDITALPFTQTITVAEAAAGTYGGVANQVWCRYISTVTTPFGFYFTSPGFNITSVFYESDGSTIIETFPTGTSGWILFDTSTYYIRLTRSNGAAIPNNFQISFDTASFLSVIPQGSFMVNDDALWPASYPFGGASIPASIWTMDGTFLGLADQALEGETGDSLPDGTVLYHNRSLVGGLDALVILDPTLALVTDFDLTPPIGALLPAFCNDGTDFYVCDLNTNGVWRVTATGTLTSLFTLPATGTVSALGVARDASVFYWAEGDEDGVIHTWDVGGGVEGTPLYTIAGFASPDTLALTPNGHPGEILVMPDGNIVTYWYDTATVQNHLLTISPAGASLYDVVYDSTVLRIDHIHYAPASSTSVYIYFYVGVSQFQGHFAEVDLTDGSELQAFTIYLNGQGVNQGTDSGVMFAPSPSCYMITLSYGGAAGTGNLVVIKVVIPSTDLTVFDFTTTGGLSPSTFSLAHGENETYLGLTPGSGYGVEETVPDGWEVSYAVSNGSPIDALEVVADETTTVTVTNSTGAVGFARELPIRWVLRTGVIT